MSIEDYELEALVCLADFFAIPGDYCDFGLISPNVENAITRGKALSSKPICVISDWLWIDITYPADVTRRIQLHGIQPSIIRSYNILYDEAQRFPVGGSVRSTPLVAFHKNAFFETRNTLYILVGHGLRKQVSPKVVRLV